MLESVSENLRAFGLPLAKRAAGLVTRAIPIPRPTLLVGPDSALRMVESVADFGHRRVLLVTDAAVAKLAPVERLIDALAQKLHLQVYAGVTPDAPLPVIEQGIDVYNTMAADAIVAIGGGSVLDAAKVIGLAAVNQRDPRSLAGYFRAFSGPPPLYVAPTTAGTGSEVTVAAVISDPEAGAKLIVADTRLVPRIAALDPLLTQGLPPAITAATGLDALTHAVEAWLSGWRTAESDQLARVAARLILRFLPRAWADGDDLIAREQMALAATWAGMAFTRANVGNVHAIAHQLGARYHVPHGLANAIMLPHVLRFSQAKAQGRMAELALALELGKPRDGDRLLARRLIETIEALKHTLDMPAQVAALRVQDIPALAAAACWEADTNYPVPRRMSEADCAALLRAVLPTASAQTKGTARGEAARRAKKPKARPKSR